jgi:CubicO group peptidase (beta-lactamase class C family)
MNQQRRPFRFGCLALAICAMLAPWAKTCGEEKGDIRALAGEWKITYDHGPVRVYIIDQNGKMRGNLDDAKWVTGYKLTGQVKRQDGMLLLIINEEDKLERLSVAADGANAGRLIVEQFDPKASYPANGPAHVAIGIRRKVTPLASAAAPGVEIGDLAGQWTVMYDHGSVRLYSFDKDGKMRGRADDLELTGQIKRKGDRLLLTFNEENKLERLTLRIDGRMALEHFDPKESFPDHGPAHLAVGTPVTGKAAPRVEVLDVIMLKCLEQIGCSGATLAVGRGHQSLYSRGYGWSDEEHKVRIDPDTPMSIASCDKPLTAAMIRQLAHNGKLHLNASVLKVLQIKPAGEVVDNRVWDITINHLLEHKAGWQGKPVEKAWQAANGQKYPIQAETLLSYVATQRLSWKPGTKEEYDSFGYNTLKRVVAKVSGRSYVDYLRHELLRPYGVQELKWVRHGAKQQGEPQQLWNGLIMEDPNEYRMGVSTPALCTFMSHFWIDGKPRDSGNPLWIMGGSWDNSTTEMIWRSDGINVAWSFNGRKDVDPADALWEKAINWLIEEKKLPRPKSR